MPHLTRLFHRCAAALLLLGAPLAACADHQATPAPTGDLAFDTSVPEVVDATDGGPADAVIVGPGPDIVRAMYFENPANHLSGWLEVETDAPATLEVVVAPAASSGKAPWRLRYVDASLETRWSLPIVGLYPTVAHRFSVTVRAAGGASTTADLDGPTPAALPHDFPPIACQADPQAMAPGFTLFEVDRRERTPEGRSGIIIGMRHCDVVWYKRGAGYEMTDVRQLSNGNLLYLVNADAAMEVDVMGDLLRVWQARDMGLDTFHHEISPLSDSQFVVISTELRTIGGYDDGAGGETAYDVVGDVLVEFDRDGVIERTWHLLDVLDPHRIRSGFHSTFWNDRYADQAPTGTTKDWSHTNGVILDPSDDSLIISIRHQDWVIKLDRQTGEVVWTLGEGGSLALIGGGSWPYHQHAPQLLDDGHLLLFDNGNSRPVDPGEPPYSRVVEYAIDTTHPDPAQWTATQVWEWRDEHPFFSSAMCDADQLENGNVLVTDGYRIAPLDGQDGYLTWARLVEVTRSEPATRVFDAALRDDPSHPAPVSWAVYRAERVPSLYPPSVAVEHLEVPGN